MNNKYLILGLVVIAIIGYFVWQQSKKSQASQVLASAPSGGGGTTVVNTGGQQVPLNDAGSLLTSLTGFVQGLLGAKSPSTPATNPNPLSNVISTIPFAPAIPAPSDKSSMPVINPTKIAPPPISSNNLPIVSIPKTDFSAPISTTTLIPSSSNNPSSGITVKPVQQSGSPAGGNFFLKNAIRLGVVKPQGGSFEKNLFETL